MRTRARFAILIAGFAALIVAGLVIRQRAEETTPPPEGRALLPDLGMEVPDDLAIGQDAEGGRVLFFSATITNVGEGEFLLDAELRGGRWNMTQEIPYSVSGSEFTSVPGLLVWGGDGHTHWHVEKAAKYWVEAVDPAADADSLPDQKAGFCFFDNWRVDTALPGAAIDPVHFPVACGSFEDDEISMGLSIGWGDRYEWTLLGQSVDITGLPLGRYRLVVEADPNGWFRELDTTNNTASVEFDIVLDENEFPYVEIVDGSERS